MPPEHAVRESVRPGCLCLLAILFACAPRSTPLREESDVRCTVMRFTKLPGPTAEVPIWIARFRVVNGAPTAIEYFGFRPDAPLFRQEVLRGNAWENIPIRQCGTGVVRQRLETGGALELEFSVPADGNFYRFRFGEPAVLTEAVRAPR